jgi:hypothetical protein
LNKFKYTLSKINYIIYGVHGVEWSGNGVEIIKISRVGVELELELELELEWEWS